MTSPLKRSDYFLVPFLMDGVIAMSGLMSNLRAQDLRATAFQLGLLGMAWGIPFALFSPFVGKAAHRLDRRLFLIAGPMLYALSVALYAFARHPMHLIAAAPLGGLACAVFWPTFETLLHGSDAEEQKRRIGSFNMGWTFGLMAGAAVSGHVYSLLGARAAFLMSCGIVLFNGLYLAWRTRHGVPMMADTAEEEDHHAATAGRPSRARRRNYLHMAWVTNFVLYFASAVVATMFPPLARSLGIGDGTIGILVALVTLAQAVCFFWIAASARWQYRALPLLAVMGVGVLGLALLGQGVSVGVFAVGLTCIGFARGVSYSASLFYGLDDTGSHGVNMGIHECLVGITYVMGPLLSGLVADAGTLRSPFMLATLVLFSGVAALLFIRKPLALPEHASS